MIKSTFEPSCLAYFCKEDHTYAILIAYIEICSGTDTDNIVKATSDSIPFRKRSIELIFGDGHMSMTIRDLIMSLLMSREK